MNSFTRTFLTGLAAILPMAITLALLVWLGSTTEDVLGGLMQYFLPDFLYFPGLGILTGIGLIFAVGVLLHVYVVRGLLTWMEGWLQRIPVINTIFGVVSDIMNLFSGDIEKKFGEAVVVALPGTDFRMVGFVTRQDFAGLPAALGDTETIAVYLPMSYQIGGYTLMLPRSQVTRLEMSLADAMRYALTAGVSAQQRSQETTSTAKET